VKASDIMSRTLQFVTPDQPVSRAAELLARGDVGMLPVVDSQEKMHVIGVITDRDITVRHVAAHHAGDCPVRVHMTAGDIVTVRADDHVHDAMGRMRHYRVRRLPVVDDEHRLVGVVSQADLALRVGRDEPRAFEQVLEAISAPALAAV
jgi:CBS domain-containing protein